MAPATDLITQVLRAHAVRLTPGRLAVLEVLLAAPYALSGTEIEWHLQTTVDRATMFRTLRLLEQKQLIHRVADYAETVRYAAAPILRPAAHPAPLPAEHVHLKCTVCQHLFCLPHVPVPIVPEAGALRISRRDCLLSGVCAQCQATTATSAESDPRAC